jgi:group I intron endonuclease
MIGYIYKTTNLINGKIYIGQKQNKKFISEYLGSGNLIKRAIRKYGKENFYVCIIHKCDTFSMLDQKEIYYIKKYNSTNSKIGYNISYGGTAAMRGRKHSKKVKNKISKSHIGLGHTEETKEKLRQFNLNRPPIADETREKLRQANYRRIYNLMSEEQKQKISKTKKECYAKMTIEERRERFGYWNTHKRIYPTNERKNKSDKLKEMWIEVKNAGFTKIKAYNEFLREIKNES